MGHTTVCLDAFAARHRHGHCHLSATEAKQVARPWLAMFHKRCSHSSSGTTLNRMMHNGQGVQPNLSLQTERHA